MKKSILAFVALVAVAGIYYMTIGSTQIVTEIKKEINHEIIELKKSGFIVEDRVIREEAEHFVIDFNNTQDITKYIKKSNNSISQSEVELLKGLKIGVDIEYTPTAKDAIAFDIYPIKLPMFLYEEMREDNESIVAIDKMLKEKLLLVHISVNKLLSGFDGYLKDINTKFDNGKSNGHFTIKGFSFNGDIKDEDVKNLKQNIKEMSFKIGKEIHIALSDLKVFIENPTDAKYNNNSSNYTLKSLNIENRENGENLSLIINDLSGSSKDTKKGELIEGIAKIDIASIDYTTGSDKILLKKANADIKIENLNIEAMEKLEVILNDENVSFEQMIPLLKKITKSDLSFSISNLSLDNITSNGEKMQGFNIKAFAKTNKDFDWNSINNDPMVLMQLGNIQANISISNTLFSVISQDPKMMMVMMFAQPIDKNGTKVYDLEFTKGSLKVNGKPFM